MILVYGGYGHNPSGKQYVYWAGDNYRTGQSVVAPVTNKRTGRTYNTMFTIQRTSKESSPMAQREESRLINDGIYIKTIGGRNVLDLPSGSQYKSASEWSRISNQSYWGNVENRLLSYKSNPNNTVAQQRLLDK